MIRKIVPAWLFRIVPTLTVLLVLGGIGATVYELHRLNDSLESLKTQGLWVHDATRFRPISAEGNVDATVQGSVDAYVLGTVDIGNTVEVEGRVYVDGTVDVEGQVDVSGCRFVGCDPVEVRIVR